MPPARISDDTIQWTITPLFYSIDHRPFSADDGT